MKRVFFLILLLPCYVFAQKKPMDHSVYDGWQSIGERLISSDGKWVVYTVTPQEGDADLFIQSTDGTNYRKQISRGYNAVITEDSRFVIFKVRPLYKETREARIKKKKPEDMPKDSIAIVELGNDMVFKTARIKSYKTPEQGFGWVAYQKEVLPSKQATPPTQKAVDSLKKTIDSLTLLVTELKNIKAGNKDEKDADEDPATTAPAVEGSDLVLRNLANAEEKTFKNVADYSFNAYGHKLVMRIAKSAKDSSSVNAVLLFDLKKGTLDTILKNGNDFKSFAFTEDGSKLAFVAERDTNKKALQRFYDLFLYRHGADSAIVLMNKHSVGMEAGYTVSENAIISFSKTGNRLLFGTAPIQPPKDTSLVEIDLVKLDIWNYKDDYLQTQQLFRLNNDLKRNYLAVYDFVSGSMQQIGSEGIPTVLPTNEGDGEYFVAVTDTGRRVEAQWALTTKKDIYAVNVKTGEKTLVKKNHVGQVYPSSTGKYILLYDNKAKHYFAWDGKLLKNITSKIKLPLYDEENDVPDDPGPYGIMAWHEGDSCVYVYDKYDVWKVDPKGIEEPKKIILPVGRASKMVYRYIRVNPEEKFIKSNQPLYFRLFSEKNKHSSIVVLKKEMGTNVSTISFITDIGGYVYNNFVKAKNSDSYLFSK